MGRATFPRSQWRELCLYGRGLGGGVWHFRNGEPFRYGLSGWRVVSALMDNCLRGVCFVPDTMGWARFPRSQWRELFLSKFSLAELVDHLPEDVGFAGFDER
jgi:hypothetical protein